MTETRTCTVHVHVGEICGAPAVYVEGEFAECAEHAADPVALARTRRVRVGAHQVGDEVEIARHGKTYTGRVVRVGARGAAYAEVEYGNGARREVRV